MEGERQAVEGQSGLGTGSKRRESLLQQQSGLHFELVAASRMGREGPGVGGMVDISQGAQHPLASSTSSEMAPPHPI